MHLRLLASAAVSPATLAKISDIRKNIASDIVKDLKKHF
jgi:hypothetical protein